MLAIGISLTTTQQKSVLAMYIQRYTGDHKPQWANGEWEEGNPYPLQFASDNEWLQNTYFNVTKNGKLSLTNTDCQSNPTWPNNPELRK